MRYLKVIALNISLWIFGTIMCGVWMAWDLENHPVPANPDGSIPDTMMIPLVGFAVVWAIFLVAANAAAWIYRRWKQQKSRS